MDIPGISDIVNAIINGLKTIAEWIEKAFYTLGTWIWNTFGSIANAIYSALQWIYNGLKYIASTFVNIIKAIWNWIVGVIKSIYNTIKGWIDGFIDTVNNWWNSIIMNIRQKIYLTVLTDVSITMTWKSYEKFVNEPSKKTFLTALTSPLWSPLLGTLAGSLIDSLLPKQTSQTVSMIPKLNLPDISFNELQIESAVEPTAPEVPQNPQISFTVEEDILGSSIGLSVIAGFPSYPEINITNVIGTTVLNNMETLSMINMPSSIGLVSTGAITQTTINNTVGGVSGGTNVLGNAIGLVMISTLSDLHQNMTNNKIGLVMISTLSDLHQNMANNQIGLTVIANIK